LKCEEKLGPELPDRSLGGSDSSSLNVSYKQEIIKQRATIAKELDEGVLLGFVSQLS